MKKFALAFLVGAIASTASSIAFGRCLNFSDDETRYHDREVSRIWQCNWDQVLEMWHRFDFDKENWDNGFGFNNACDTRRPLMRTFNALYLLKYAGTSYPTCNYSGNMLTWAYCWAGNSIDELDGECEKSTSSSYTFATTRHGWFVDNWTKLYYHFFYHATPVERAATIIHEARHAQGWCSHQSCGCPRGVSCDPSYFNGCRGFGSSNGLGANGYQILFLEWFATNARRAWSTSWMKDVAVSTAKSVLRKGFCNSPCFTIDDDGYPTFTCSRRN